MDFRPVRMIDRPLFMEMLRSDPPQVSELTFTNLYMWRKFYQPLWCLYNNVLAVIMRPNNGKAFALPPIGPGDKKAAVAFLCKKMDAMGLKPVISRADKNLVELLDYDKYYAEFDRDNSDYVYLIEDLIKLKGNKYHKKKNHISKFKRSYEYEYYEMSVDTIDCALTLQEDWCEFRNCADNPDLSEEDTAIYEALTNFDVLECQGGIIMIKDKLEAFTFGEMLNQDTVVIHVEKANPQIPGLYAMINRLFLKHCWTNVQFVNREQDLGLEGLRVAKESYLPHHMVDKYNIHLR